LAAPLLVRSVAESWQQPAWVGSAPAVPVVGTILGDVRVEGIDPTPEEDGAPEALMLTVRH
jgi:hypothetical protein